MCRMCRVRRLRISSMSISIAIVCMMSSVIIRIMIFRMCLRVFVTCLFAFVLLLAVVLLVV